VTARDCLFCKIVSGDIPSTVVYEDEQIIAIKDIQPVAPVHLLIIPRKHIISLNEVDEQDTNLLGHIQLTAASLARENNTAVNGYRLLCNNGAGGGQEVLHLHYHLLGGRNLEWPPG
jgi:histidine triad (HIT) family protein